MYRERRDDKNILIGYIRNSDNATIPLATGNRDYQAVLQWVMNGNIPDVDSDVLDKIKRLKITEYKNEGLRRIKLQISEWDTFDKVAFIASIWNMLGTANAKQVLARNIYVYVKGTAIPNINAQTDIVSVQAIDVVGDPGWLV